MTYKLLKKWVKNLNGDLKQQSSKIAHILDDPKLKDFSNKDFTTCKQDLQNTTHGQGSHPKL